jgi:hydroxymethylglutaryl-CoA lyase
VNLAALPKTLRVVEVGLRDGLQSVTTPISTEAKVEIVEGLIDSGVREIEAVSFAHPKVLPQLADAEAVMSRVPRAADVRYRGLVPNLRGALRAADCGLHEVVALACCDEQVSIINQGRGVQEVLDEIPKIAQVVRESGADFTVGIAMAFFATGTGLTPPDVPVGIARRALDAGATGIYLADTSGMADPLHVGQLVETVRSSVKGLSVGVHLHTRNGMALANTLAALAAGVDWVESAFAGLGGDLWFPGVPEVLGNTPTEDVVSLADAIGVRTGIDLKAYLQLVHRVATIVGRDPISYAIRGGTRDELAAVDWSDAMISSEYRTTTK